MRKYALLIFVLSLSVPMMCAGQRRKAVKKPKKEVVAEKVENPLVTQMLEAVQRVVFIDSMVVGKDDFYNHIPLSTECGRIQQRSGMGQYTSGLRDRRIEAKYQKGDSMTCLVMSDFIGKTWTDMVDAEALHLLEELLHGARIGGSS